MRFRSLAAVVLLLLVAAAGVVVVRELTSPVPGEPIPPITIDPDRGVQAGESVEDEEGSRKQRRKRDRDREGGFEPPSAATPEPTPAERPTPRRPRSRCLPRRPGATPTTTGATIEP